MPVLTTWHNPPHIPSVIAALSTFNAARAGGTEHHALLQSSYMFSPVVMKDLGETLLQALSSFHNSAGQAAALLTSPGCQSHGNLRGHEIISPGGLPPLPARSL